MWKAVFSDFKVQVWPERVTRVAGKSKELAPLHRVVGRQEIEVNLKLKIRDERRFNSLEELQRQLEKDAALCNPDM